MNCYNVKFLALVFKANPSRGRVFPGSAGILPAFIPASGGNEKKGMISTKFTQPAETRGRASLRGLCANTGG